MGPGREQGQATALQRGELDVGQHPAVGELRDAPAVEVYQSFAGN